MVEVSYYFQQMTRGRKLTGQQGAYEFICEMKPKVQDKDIFSLIALAFDMTGKHGFVLLVNNEQPKPLQYV